MECTNLVVLGQKAIIFKKIIELSPKNPLRGEVIKSRWNSHA